jgi:hypothetical protein
MKIKLKSNHTEENKILASSPWVKAEGLLPHRIVLRISGKMIDLNIKGLDSFKQSEFVIHTEVQEGVAHGYDTTYFHQGDYTHSVRDAWAIFCERSNDLMEKAHKTTYQLIDVEEEVANV